MLDASLALQWFLEDESGRQYGLSVLASFPANVQWFRSCGSMKWATAFSWPTGGSGLHLIKSTVF